MITASVVTYNTSKENFDRVVQSILNTKQDIILYISDNSETDTIRNWCLDKRIRYVFNNSNNGYGFGHNVAIKQAMKENSQYHFVINPDIFFNPGTLESIVLFMNQHTDVALAMPKVLNENNTVQYVAKMIPTPIDIFLRGFASKIPLISKSTWLRSINYNFEMHFADNSKNMLVPCISGCFMIFRTSVFSEIGLFDDRFFMYFEDFDLSRRIAKIYKTVLISSVSVYHEWERGAHTNKKLRKISIKSAIKYFNKYGWLIDKERYCINKMVINRKGLYE